MPKLKLNVPLPMKGIDVSVPGEYVDSRGATANKNIRAERGLIQSRPGTTALGSTAGEQIQAFFELEQQATTSFIRVGLTIVEEYSKAGDSWSSIANTPLTGLATDIVDHAFPLLSGEKVAVYTNGIDAIRKFTGTGNDADLGGTPPKAKFVVSYGGYLVIAYITNDGANNVRPYRVQWSDTGDIETWSSGNAGSVDLLEDPEEITAINTYGNFITVHKRNSIYVGQIVTTSDVFRFDRRATGVGAVSPLAIQNIITGDQVFLGTDGIHIFNGITAPLIPSPVQDELRDSINPEYVHKATSVIKEEDDEVWFAVPIGSQTTPDTVYKYNYRLNQVYKDERTNLTAMGLFLNTNEPTWDDAPGTWDTRTYRWDSKFLLGLNPLVAFGFSDGVTTKDDESVDNDNGSAFTSNFETKDFTAQDLGAPDLGLFVQWTGMQLWAKGTDINVAYSTDSGTTWTSVVDISLGSDYPGDDDPDHAWFDVASTKIRFRFQKDGSSESFSLKKYYIEATVREQRI